MKAAVMHAVGQRLVVEDLEVSDPRPGELVVRVVASGLCHSDLAFLDGSYSHPLPTVLGHEAAGVVEAVGEDVSAVSPGDGVVMSLSASCGVCHYCISRRPHLCIGREATRRGPGERPRLTRSGREVHQFLDLSSFAELMLVHESTVVSVPADVPLDRAALLGCGVATGLGAIFNTARVGVGESVCVLGCGGVGLAAVQGARMAGAGAIIAVDAVASKLDLATSLGATHTINARQEDTVATVRELTDGLGVDHAIEAIGSRVTAQQAFAMLCRGGTATIVGLIPGEQLSISTDELFYERRIQGSVMGSNDFRRDTPRYVQMYLDGRLDIDAMVTKRLALEQVNDGFEEMRAGTAVRSLIVFD